MSKLADKIRRAREFTREIDGWTLKLRRPTDAEAGAILGQDSAPVLKVATDFVIGWEGVTEADLINSGASDPAPFDKDTWAEVIVDRPNMWEPICTAVVNAWVEHNKARTDRAKN